MDEQAAVQASKDGDREAFSVLVDRYYQSIYRFAYGCIGNHQDADDICQETFAKVLDKIHGLKDGDRFKSWIFAIAANVLRAQAKRSQRSRRHDLQAASGRFNGTTVASVPAGRMAADERAATVWKALEQMERPVRMAAVLTLMQDHPQKEAARIIGCSEASISRYVQSARSLLEARLRHLVD